MAVERAHERPRKQPWKHSNEPPSTEMTLEAVKPDVRNFLQPRQVAYRSPSSANGEGGEAFLKVPSRNLSV